MAQCQSNPRMSSSIFVILVITVSVSSNNLLLAVQRNSIEEVRRILDDPTTDIEASDCPETSPLFAALTKRRTSVANLLIRQGANVNVCYWKTSTMRATPLHIAVVNKMKSCVTLLLAYEADVHALCNLGYTPLHYAAADGNVEIADALLDKGALLEVQNHMDQTPLHCAAEKGCPHMVKRLLEAGADTKAEDADGNAPLHLIADLTGDSSPHVAVDNKLKTCVTLLLEFGADVQARSNLGYTPLHYAVANGNLEIVDALLNNGALLEAKNYRDQTPLNSAAERGCLNTVERLLEAGANIEAENGDGNCPLHLAANVAVANTLIKNGASLNKRNYQGRTPFQHAIHPLLVPNDNTSRTDVALALVQAGSDLNVRDDEMNTVLHTACSDAHCDLILLDALLRHGGPFLNSRNANGRTPLQMAVLSLKEENSKDNLASISLIEAGADVNDLTTDDLYLILRTFWPNTSQLLEFQFEDFDDYVVKITNVNVPRRTEGDAIPEHTRDVRILRKEHECDEIRAYALYRLLKCLYRRKTSAASVVSKIENMKFSLFDDVACRLTKQTYLEKLPLDVFLDILHYETYKAAKLEGKLWNSLIASYTMNRAREVRKFLRRFHQRV